MINQLGVSKQSVTVDWILEISDKQDNLFKAERPGIPMRGKCWQNAICHLNKRHQHWSCEWRTALWDEISSFNSHPNVSVEFLQCSDAVRLPEESGLTFHLVVCNGVMVHPRNVSCFQVWQPLNPQISKILYGAATR